MIFVTVGAQMPFDRLVRTVDEWAGRNRRSDVIAQIGSTRYRPIHLRYAQMLEPEEFYSRMDEADLIVAHAGMGSIISAVERGKPILVMPRRSDLGETRNDHQIATARRFESLHLVQVAMNEADLFGRLGRLDALRPDGASLRRATAHCANCPYASDPQICPDRHTNAACPHLLTAVHTFVADEQVSADALAIAPEMAGAA